MVFKFYPSKGLTGNGGPPSVHKNACATCGTLRQEEYHGLIMGDKTTDLSLRMCSSSRQNP